MLVQTDDAGRENVSEETNAGAVELVNSADDTKTSSDFESNNEQSVETESLEEPMVEETQEESVVEVKLKCLLEMGTTKDWFGCVWHRCLPGPYPAWYSRQILLMEMEWNTVKPLVISMEWETHFM